MAQEQLQGQRGLQGHLSPEVLLVQQGTVSGDDVEDGRRPIQVLLILRTELFCLCDSAARQGVTFPTAAVPATPSPTGPAAW